MKDELTGNNLKKEEGISTMEMLIAFAVLTISISAVIMVVFGNQNIALDTRLNNEALYFAQQQLEKARADASFDFNLLNPTGPNPEGDIYESTLEVFQEDFWTKRVVSLIDWTTEGRDLHVELTTLVTNPAALAGGDTCSSILEGDWTEPEMISYEFGKDLLSDPNSDYVVNDIDVFNKKMYVATSITHSNNTNTFFIFNLSNDPTSPVPISAIPNDPNPSIKEGINGIHISGDYAYSAKATGPGNGQLQLIDISVNPPVANTPFQVPGVTGNNTQAIGKTIFYQDGYVYLGLSKTGSGPEFNVIDVSNPLVPQWKAGFSFGEDVNSIIVRDGYAYVATPNNGQELTILRINKNQAGEVIGLTSVGGFNAPGAGNNGDGKSLSMVGNDLFFGRTSLTGNELYMLDNSDHESMLPILGSKDIKDGNDDLNVNGIIIRDYLVFLIAFEQFQIWELDKTTDPWSLSPWASPLTFPTQGGGSSPGTTSDCEGNYIYVGSVPSGNQKGSLSIIGPGPGL